MKNSAGDQQQLRPGGAAVKRIMTGGEQEIVISMLLNAVHYFLDCVLIIHSPRQYRLLVFHSGRILQDKQYTSIKGAKIAFHKTYRHQAWAKGVKARWDEYIPERCWIEKKMEILYQRGDM